MGQILYEGMLDSQPSEILAKDDKTYTEPNSVRITDDWNTSIEDFGDDYDDYQDLNFPSTDDDF